MENTSKSFQINWVDVWKSVRTALVVGLSAIVLWFISAIEPQLVSKIPEQFGILLPIVTFVTELVRRWAVDHTK